MRRGRSRPLTRNANILALLGVLLIGIGLAAAGGVTPAKVFGGKEAAEPQPVAVDTAALLTDYSAARKARMYRLLHSKKVLGVPRAKLESIAECESHGNPRSIGGGGLYRGKYQFDRGTWHSTGGKGDPAKAPEIEQDRRAAMLYKAAGTNPWPVCG